MHVDLFSGIGGFSVAAEACGLDTVLHVERDEARKADLRRNWPDVPIVEDVNDVEGIRRVVADSAGRNANGNERCNSAQDAAKTRGWNTNGGGRADGGQSSASPCRESERSVQFALPSWSGMYLEEGGDGKWRATVPGLGILAHGISGRASMLKGLGNSIVPQVAAEVIRAILIAEGRT